MIPYTRALTSVAFLAIAGCTLNAVFDPGQHPFIGADTMLLASLSALVVLLISLYRNFVADLIAITLTAFFTQRIFVIYVWPGEVEYQRSWYLRLTFDNDVMFHATRFYLFSAIAILLGAMVALSGKRARRPVILNRPDGTPAIPPVSFFGRKMSFVKFSELCSWVIIAGFVLNTYVLFVQGIGFTGQSLTRDTSVIRRLSTMGSSLGIFNVLATVAYWKQIREHKVILWAMILSSFGGIIVAASKGGQIGLFLNLITSLYILRGIVPRKLVKYSFLMIMFTAFVYYNVAMQLRNFILAYQLGGEVESYYSAPVSDVLFAFSQRLGGFDWLAATMKIGRELYYPSANLLLDLKESVNSLVPGDLFATPTDYVPISKLIPHLTRGIPLDYELGGHNEVLGGLGTAYVYFGDLGGPVALFVWVWGLVAFDRKKSHPVVRMFVLCFVLGWLQSGQISSTFFHLINILYLSLMIYTLKGVGAVLRTPAYPHPDPSAGLL